jgi:peptidyl-tRNA hydrolase
VPYVLSPFPASEQRQLPELVDRSADAALKWLREGIISAMNEYNRKPEANAIAQVVAPRPDHGS